MNVHLLGHQNRSGRPPLARKAIRQFEKTGVFDGSFWDNVAPGG